MEKAVIASSIAEVLDDPTRGLAPASRGSIPAQFQPFRSAEATFHPRKRRFRAPRPTFPLRKSPVLPGIATFPSAQVELPPG